MFISEAWAQGTGGGSDFLVQLFPLVLIFIVFYFLLIRPQQSKTADHPYQWSWVLASRKPC